MKNKSGVKNKTLDYHLLKKNKEREISNMELTSFSNVASHDLQEPLRKIQTFGNSILDKDYDNLTEQGRDSCRRMNTAPGRMQKFIEDLLAFTRSHTSVSNFEQVDLNLESGSPSVKRLWKITMATLRQV